MSKRKHSALEDDMHPGKGPSATEGSNDFRSTRLRRRFERGTQLLFRALKTARGIERQKLGRRQKTAAKEEDGKALERLAAEVQALKVRSSICGFSFSKLLLTTTVEPQPTRNRRAVFTQTTAKDQTNRRNRGIRTISKDRLGINVRTARPSRSQCHCQVVQV